jgi:hypothetical protein
MTPTAYMVVFCDRQRTSQLDLQGFGSCKCNGCFENDIALVTILGEERTPRPFLPTSCVAECLQSVVAPSRKPFSHLGGGARPR